MSTPEFRSSQTGKNAPTTEPSQNASQPDAPKDVTPANQENGASLRPESQQIKEEVEKLKAEKLRKKLALLKGNDEDEIEQPKSGKRERDKQISAVKAPPPVPRARVRKRHVWAVLSFLALVLLPVALSAFYLWSRAADRYVSYVGFSVRTEEIGSAFELLGGVAELSGSSSSDTDILYKFIQSPELVSTVDRKLGIRNLWSKPGYDLSDDPVFAYHPPGTIEDLTAYWSRMVNVYSDSGTGLVDLEVQAFTPEDARMIAQLIYDESSDMINRLSAIARADATRYAKDEVDKSVERLKSAREALTRFRNRTQIVDPSASIQSQMGILSSLQGQLAETLIDLDILRQTTRGNDPRITQTERRVEVIEVRIAEEREKLGIGTAGVGQIGPKESDRAFADLVGEYERLAVDLQFAEQAYISSLAAYDSALAEANRQSRYLAAHVRPTLPESPERPYRFMTLSLVALFSFLAWAVVVLVAYALKDRR